MSICGKTVDALQACKRSNRDFFHISTGNTYTIPIHYLLFLYYVGSPKVPPRVFGPLGPKTLRGQLCISLQMMEAMNDSVKAIEEKMSAPFTKIDYRLESLEAQKAGSLVSKF